MRVILETILDGAKREPSAAENSTAVTLEDRPPVPAPDKDDAKRQLPVFASADLFD